MEMFIHIVNETTVGHPILLDNFRAAFPEIDVDNLPPKFARFIRTSRPIPGVYQVINDIPVYEIIDGTWTDVWGVRNMTMEEMAAKQQITKDNWATLPDRDYFTAWTFNADTCTYQPPIPRPSVGAYFWQGSTNSWAAKPAYPTDDKDYKFNFKTETWVVLT